MPSTTRMYARRLTAVAILYVQGAFAQDAKALNEEGKSALASGNLPAALAKFRQAAESDASNAQIQFNIGLALLRLGQPKQAIPALRKAAAEPALAMEARYLLGFAYFESGEFSEAAAPLSELRDSPHA